MQGIDDVSSLRLGHRDEKRQADQARVIIYPASYRNGVWHRQLFEEFEPTMLKVLRRECEGYQQVVISFE